MIGNMYTVSIILYAISDLETNNKAMAKIQVWQNTKYLTLFI